MPANYPYIQVPFATSGDKDSIPVQTDPSGAISWTQGYGPDYQRDLATDPLAKPIERGGMNQLFYAISAAIKAWQDNCVPDWVPASETGGIQNPYTQGTWVRYTTGGTTTLYVSLEANNTETPGSGTKWAPAPFRSASDAEVLAGAGAFPATVTQVKSMITAFAPSPADASLTQKGIVQLSNAVADSGDDSKAATPSAVARKFGTALATLGASDNLNNLTAASQRGVYWQENTANATTANGYPPNATAGCLFVMGQVNAAPMQVYFMPNGKAWSRSRNTGNTAWNAWTSMSDGYGTPISATNYNAITTNGQYSFPVGATNKPPSFNASWAMHYVNSGEGGTLAFDLTTSVVAYRGVTPGGYGGWTTLWSSVNFDAPGTLSRVTTLEQRQLPLGQGQTWKDYTSIRLLGTNYTNTTGRTIMISVMCQSTAGAAPTPTIALFVNGAQVCEVATGDDYGPSMEKVKGTIVFAIPAGATYQVAANRNTSSLIKWSELTV